MKISIPHSVKPWDMREVRITNYTGVDIVAANGAWIATVHHDVEFDSLPANAALISASPDLLEALLAIIEIGKRNLENPKYDAYFDNALAAIAKATTIEAAQ